MHAWPGRTTPLAERKRILLASIGIMVAVSLAAATIAIYVLYDAAVEEQELRLTESLWSHVRMIESVARNYAPIGEAGLASDRGEATLQHLAQAEHTHFYVLGKSGELMAARREGPWIVWILRERQASIEPPPPVPFDSRLAEPMRRALRGESGTLIGADYRGSTVLAAYAPIPGLGWGVVTKIDLAEINGPFWRAGVLTGAIALLVVAIGVGLVFRLISPLIEHLETRTRELREAHDRLEARVVERTRQLSLSNEALRREVAEREQAQNALREERDFAEGLIETAPVIVLILDREGRVVRYNRYMEELSGYRLDEIRGRDWFETFLPASERDAIRERFASALSGTRTQGGTNPIVTRDGAEREIEWYDTTLEDSRGELFGILAVGRDITDHKRLQLQLRAAASETALAEDRERRKLAEDLHDGLGQLLALASMKVGLLREALGEPGLERLAGELQRILAEAHQRTGSLSFQLSPPILHDVGLWAAIQWLAEDLKLRYGLQVTVEDQAGNCPLAEETRISVFRSLRELLMNVTKHAHTDKARVHLAREDRFARITVEDKGVGFEPTASAGGYGLFSISERLAHLGGRMELQSSPGAGTRVVLLAPIDGSET